MRKLSFLLLLMSANLYAQRADDSLVQRVFDSSLSENDRVEACADVAWAYRQGPPDSMTKYVDLFESMAEASGEQGYIGQGMMLRAIYHVYMMSDSATAMGYAQRGLKLCLEHGKEWQAGEYFLNMGTIHFIRYQFPQARKYYLEAIDVATSTNNDVMAVGYLLSYGLTFFYEGQNALALAEMERALALSISLEDTTERRGIYSTMGSIYAAQGDLDKSYDYRVKSLELARATNSMMGTVSELCNIGNVYKAQGDIPTAMNYYQEALAIAENASEANWKMAEFLSNILNNLASTYSSQSDYDRALKYFLRSLDISEGRGNKRQALMTIRAITSTLYYLEEDSISRKYIDRGIALAKDIGNNRELALLLGDKASVYLRAGELDSALVASAEGLSLARNIEDAFLLTSTLSTQAWVLQERGEHRVAIPLAEEALTLAQSSQQLTQIQRAADVLWRSQEAIGQDALALQSYQLYVETQDSINREENQRAAIEFEFKQQAMQDSLAFAEQQALTQVVYERELAQRNYLLLAGLGAALLGVLGFYFWQQRRLKEKELTHQREMLSSTILTQEQERQRIAKDLHDSVGSKLGVMNLFLHQLNRKSPEAETDVRDMLGVVGETIQTTRRISHDLLPPTLETFGLATAIQELGDQVAQTQGPGMKIEIEGERPEGVAPLVELNLFRILQELLNNSLKYAQANQISLRLIQSADKIILQYHDDGIGFDPQRLENQKGLGMQNIQSRLQMIEGKMDLQSAPGQGVQVQVEVAH